MKLKLNELFTGQTFYSKAYRLSREEIIQFAKVFDPQYFHIDEKKALESHFKGIIASGLHTLSISWKLWVDIDVFKDVVIGGAGMNNIRFVNPVYPDDQLSVTVEIQDIKISKNNKGVVTLFLTTYNELKSKVLEAEIIGIVKV